MNNYNFTPEHIDDVNTQKSIFCAKAVEQSSNLIDLKIFKPDVFSTADKEFWKIFIKIIWKSDQMKH